MLHDVNLNDSLMKNQNENRNDPRKAIVALQVLFFAIILREVTIDSLSTTWLTLMGAIIIGLSVSVMLLPDRKGG